MWFNVVNCTGKTVKYFAKFLFVCPAEKKNELHRFIVIQGKYISFLGELSLFITIHFRRFPYSCQHLENVII